MAISPEEKYRLLVGKIGPDEVKRKIAELKAQGKAVSNLRAVDILYQDAQWELVQGNIDIRGFYLGTYKRGPPGMEIVESFLLTHDGVSALLFEKLEALSEVDGLDGNGILAPIQVAGVDLIKNIGTEEHRLRARENATVKRISLPPQLMAEWSNELESVADEPKPVFLVEAITAVRDVVPPTGWQDAEGGRRQRVDGVPPLPVITEKGELNLKFSLGDGGSRTSVKVSSGDDLMSMLEDGDTDNPEEWFAWIQKKALSDHDAVMDELRPFTGRQLVVFGSGGSEIQRRDPESGKRSTLQLSSSFVTTNQFGFMTTYKNASQKVQELSQGEAVEVATPSAAERKPKHAAEPPKDIKEALMELIGEKGASKDDVKKLLKSHGGDELIEAVDQMTKEGLIKYDKGSKKYVKTG